MSPASTFFFVYSLTILLLGSISQQHSAKAENPANNDGGTGGDSMNPPPAPADCANCNICPYPCHPQTPPPPPAYPGAVVPPPPALVGPGNCPPAQYIPPGTPAQYYTPGTPLQYPPTTPAYYPYGGATNRRITTKLVSFSASIYVLLQLLMFRGEIA